MESGRDQFKKSKFIINLFYKLFNCFPKVLLIYVWNCMSNHSQILFVGLRYVILKCLIKNIGENIKIGTNVQILGWNNLEIGDNVSIHSNCYIDANGGIKIGNNVSIAHNSTILSANHDWTDESVPIKYNPVTFKPVTISDDVWVGCGCRILAGVKINSRSVIAAGAVVNKDIESNTIVGGVPAKILKRI
ncbi:acetyltransferase [Sphingobacterium faecium NBRC 15299]|uniref:acyltransferase n=1 Tax=Sphingobacterium faecium TaxID=34087 RepID=UPI000D486158|nr:acyltransferase [Sphingobacterium faecium]PTX12475.1 acetyltransferase-like isoleucine patch superfamily enzyme [Sphingobacterium faecium]GEM62184.1 acetyltransferase [Sphingobacterium faecium NBRC 15299]